MRHWSLVLALCLYGCGCSRSGETPPKRGSSAPAVPGSGVETAPVAEEAASAEAPGAEAFTDITEDSGVRFTHFNDASPHKYLPETMGSGAAFFDYDGDGKPDLYLVNGAPLRGDRSGARSGSLYRNMDGKHFQDMTRAAKLDAPFYGMGAAVGDFDNDGHPDLLVTGLDEDRLYHNRGDGTFQDVTRAVGLANHGFSSSAAFVDYDRDGYLDLLIGRYVEWTVQSDIKCSPDGSHKIYCTPEVYKGQSNRLYHNISGRRFQDVTRPSGIYNPEGKTLGVAVLDHNRDGWPDLAIANDTVRNFLYLNNRDGTFSEIGVAAGMAYSESGATRGGMGIDAADVDSDGYADIVIGNFAQEMDALYRGSEKGYYVDDAAQAGIGLPTLMTLAFGSLLLDFDNDTRLDLIFVNGHIEPDISQIHARQSYAQPMQFFRNEGNGHFKLLTGKSGSVFQLPLVGRGLAAADIDGDGDLDLVITQNGRKAVLLRNNSAPQSWVRVRFEGRASNRTGYGTVVRAVAGNRVVTRSLTSGRSYLSACEPVLTIGLGNASKLDRLEITWPSGTTQTLEKPALNQLLVVEEPAHRKGTTQ